VSIRKKPPVPDHLLRFARGHRREPTDAEKKLWEMVRDRRLAGFKFRREQPLGRYILDFYCHEAKLCVELDGSQHMDEPQAARDEERTKWLMQQGVRVVRFWDHHLLKYPDVVRAKIYEELTGESATPGPAVDRPAEC
jgi:very-short-patch-repair endonuclease